MAEARWRGTPSDCVCLRSNCPVHFPSSGSIRLIRVSSVCVIAPAGW